MNKTVREIDLGGGEKRHLVELRSDKFDLDANPHITKMAFLAMLINDGVYTGLLNCGPLPFETMRVFKESDCWVVVLEAEETSN